MKRTMAVLLVLCLLTGCSASTGVDYGKQKEEERKSKSSSSLSSSSESSSSETMEEKSLVEKVGKEINNENVIVENTVKERIDIFNTNFFASSDEALTLANVQLSRVMNVVKDYEDIKECFIMFTKDNKKLLYGIGYKVGESKITFINKEIGQNKIFDVNKDYSINLDSGEILEPSDRSSGSSSQSSSDNKVTWYKEGMYKVGKDIEAGEYVIKATSSCYMAVKKDSTGERGTIITNDNFDTFMFITVKDSQYLEVNRGEFAKADKITINKPENGIYGEGMYRIGTDIPAGEYKIKANSGTSCYMEVTSDSTGENGTIVTNDNFDSEIYVTVKDGQYLKVSRGTIIT